MQSLLLIIYPLESSIAIVEFFLVLKKSVFFYGLSDILHRIHEKMQIMGSHQHR